MGYRYRPDKTLSYHDINTATNVTKLWIAWLIRNSKYNGEEIKKKKKKKKKKKIFVLSHFLGELLDWRFLESLEYRI